MVKSSSSSIWWTKGKIQGEVMILASQLIEVSLLISLDKRLAMTWGPMVTEASLVTMSSTR